LDLSVSDIDFLMIQQGFGVALLFGDALVESRPLPADLFAMPPLGLPGLPAADTDL
jgi:hypothetical protein